jgi:ubiquinone/menaquinone biosynthesis C-methylase UbiE
LLGRVREQAVRVIVQRHRSEVERLAPAVREGSADARRQLERVADRALGEMRTEVASAAHRAGLGWAAALDAWWRDTTALEYLDDPWLDQRVRVRILSRLDQMNALLDSYWAFFERLRPWLDARRPTKVLDLAAGHGGFALAAARLARERELSVSVTASDIKPEYLELGRQAALAQGLDVTFVVQDALDLGNLEPAAYDVITCTQSLHHFSAGHVAVMFAEAARVAGRGVLFIDGERSALNAAAIASVGLFMFRDRAFTHDALISFRRFFVAQELELLAALTPWGERARAEWNPPGHCVLSLVKGGSPSAPGLP